MHIRKPEKLGNLQDSWHFPMEWIHLLDEENSSGLWIYIDNPNAVCYTVDKNNKERELQ